MANQPMPPLPDNDGDEDDMTGAAPMGAAPAPPSGPPEMPPEMPPGGTAPRRHAIGGHGGGSRGGSRAPHHGGTHPGHKPSGQKRHHGLYPHGQESGGEDY